MSRPRAQRSILPVVVRPIRTPSPQPIQSARVSASDAKNGFGRILDRVAREGRVEITKHEKTCAVLISIDEFRSLIDARESVLDSLEGEFDALFERMQGREAAAAMQKAFAAAPAELRRAAVKSSVPRRAAAKRARHGRD